VFLKCEKIARLTPKATFGHFVLSDTLPVSEGLHSQRTGRAWHDLQEQQNSL
jgi:hypothetical protein